MNLKFGEINYFNMNSLEHNCRVQLFSEPIKLCVNIVNNYTMRDENKEDIESKW
jgi:hypothetical protein